jgi:hypothetical protein
MFHSNTLTPSYLINLYVKSNNIMLAAVNVQKDRKANLIEKGIDFLASDSSSHCGALEGEGWFLSPVCCDYMFGCCPAGA